MTRTKYEARPSILFALTALQLACTGEIRPPTANSREDDSGVLSPAGAIPSDVETAETAEMRCTKGGPQPVDRVRIHPAPGKSRELLGVRIQGSNSGPTNDFVDLTTIDEAPPEGTFTEVTFANDRIYRYVKLYAPTAGTGAVAELELYHGDTRILGKAFGTAGGGAVGGFADGVDGAVDTWFAGSPEGGSYVGLDVAGDAIAAAPTFTPAGGQLDGKAEIEIVTASPGARIRYTTDASNPTRAHGTLYEGRLSLQKTSSVKAIAYADCLFDSQVSSARFQVGSAPVTDLRGLKTYHIGNSLTDTINPWLKPIADSTGVDHQYARWTIPGAAISWLSEHRGDGFGDPMGAQNIDAFAASWAPIEHISLQPFADPSLNKEGAAALSLLQPVLASSPDVQVWIYAQWPARDMPGQKDVFKMSSFATGAAWSLPPWDVARQPTNWEEATLNHQTYHQAFRTWLDERIPGKPVRVVPGGRGLVKLKQAIERGEIPGVTEFFNAHFSDDLHLSEKGQYLVALVFYASLYERSPEGAMFAGTGLNEEQARAYQRIAWETVQE